MFEYNNVEVSEMASRRYELTNEQLDKIKHYFEAAKKNGRPYKNELALACDLQDLSIDSTSVKVHKDVGSKKKELIGKNRGGNTTKVHVATDGLGNLVKVKLTAGQVHDVTVAPALIADFKPDVVIADAAYDSDKFREQISAQGAIACIKFKRYRRIATCYYKLVVIFIAFIHVACILIWLL